MAVEVTCSRQEGCRRQAFFGDVPQEGKKVPGCQKISRPPEVAEAELAGEFLAVQLPEDIKHGSQKEEMTELVDDETFWIAVGLDGPDALREEEDQTQKDAGKAAVGHRCLIDMYMHYLHAYLSYCYLTYRLLIQEVK